MKRFLLVFVLSLALTVFASFPAQAAFTPTTCSNNFLTCVTTKFASKFPFDIFGNVTPEEITCPSISFFSKPFDMCFLYNTVKVLKYPLVASLLIKIYLFS